MKTSSLIACWFVLGGICVGQGTAQASGAVIVEIPTATPHSFPQGLDVAADGSVFYAETAAGKIGRIQGLVVTREYLLPSGSAPNIVKVKDGVVWFTDGGNSAIGRLDPLSGAVVEYSVPSGASPYFLQIGADGSKWFSEPERVGRLFSAGVVTEWQIPLEKADSHIEQISLDPSGNLWFTELNYDGLGPSGTNWVRCLHPGSNEVTEYAVPTFGGTPAGVAATRSGQIWVSEYFAGALALLDPSSAPHSTTTVIPNASMAAHPGSGPSSPLFSAPGLKASGVSGASHLVSVALSPGWKEYPLPSSGANPEDMRIDERGHVFFEEDGGMLGKLDPVAAQIVEYPIPSPESGYYNIALVGRSLWFSESGAFATVPTKIGVLFR